MTEDPVRRDRKYKAFWAVFLLTTALLVFGRIGADHYVEVVSMVFGLYMAGNVGEHYTKRKDGIQGSPEDRQ